MPASAVIPAQLAYIKVAAVKKFVVEFLLIFILDIIYYIWCEIFIYRGIIFFTLICRLYDPGQLL